MRDKYEFLTEGRILLSDIKELCYFYSLRLNDDKKYTNESNFSRIKIENDTLKDIQKRLDKYLFEFGRFIAEDI